MEVFFFLIQAFILSLSGVMIPGPVTATAVAVGVRRKYSGALVAIGHGIFEFPMVLLIVLGLDKLFRLPETKMVIGLVGGALLVMMAIQILINLKAANGGQKKDQKHRPILAGILLSAGNPYLLLWWATIGLSMATDAKEFGVWIFCLFAMVHWLCDLLWLTILSMASFKGAKLLGDRGRRTVLLICSGALFFFGLKFIYNSAGILVTLLNG